MTSWQPTASNVQTKSLGMTAPINTEEPKPADIELTLALEVLDLMEKYINQRDKLSLIMQLQTDEI